MAPSSLLKGELFLPMRQEKKGGSTLSTENPSWHQGDPAALLAAMTGSGRRMNFNLLDVSLDPMTFLDGRSEDLSIRNVFLRAPEIRKVACDLPTQSFAIMRILLAIAHDAIGFHDVFEVVRVAEHGLDTNQVLAYLERYQDRFDLFHPKRPFFQVADLRTAKGETAGLEKLVADVPNGSQVLDSLIWSWFEQDHCHTHRNGPGGYVSEETPTQQHN